MILQRVCRTVAGARLAGCLPQCVEQRLGVLEVCCVEALGEPVVHRCEQIVRLLPLAVLGPQPREVARGTQLQRPGALLARDFQGALQIGDSFACRVAEARKRASARSLCRSRRTACPGCLPEPRRPRRSSPGPRHAARRASAHPRQGPDGKPRTGSRRSGAPHRALPRSPRARPGAPRSASAQPKWIRPRPSTARETFLRKPQRLARDRLHSSDVAQPDVRQGRRRSRARCRSCSGGRPREPTSAPVPPSLRA